MNQGAGGNGNVLKEIVDPHGARYELRKIPVGRYNAIHRPMIYAPPPPTHSL